MHRSKNSFLEWLVYSLIFFFLYDIIWILVDLPDFLQSISGLVVMLRALKWSYHALIRSFFTECINMDIKTAFLAPYRME